MVFELLEHQTRTLPKLTNGCILVGGVGSGKSVTALAYFSKTAPDKRIIVITTAKKRDTGEWFKDAMMMSLNQDLDVDSWNNIKKYEDVEDACFVFDEQRIVGGGAWVKAFLKISKKNQFILLSATPADTYMDLVPIFIANGFYKNKTEFNQYHVRFSRFSKYPKVDGYLDTHTLDEYRRRIYVEMPFDMPAKREEHIVKVAFDKDEQRRIYSDRWNIYENQPIKDAGEMVRLMRKSTNLHWSRYKALISICKDNPKVIVFYNHNYELHELRLLMTELDIPVSEWNGHYHQDIPDGDRWIYLVQYQAGSEGWNCIETNVIVFYSLPYSYRNFAQAKGRIDRLNTMYETLHYYIFKSGSIIDLMIWRSLQRKQNFNQLIFGARNWQQKAA